MSENWIDDGHTASIALQGRALMPIITCPYESFAPGKVPACRMQNAAQCALEAAAIEYSGDELWSADYDADFTIPGPDFHLAWHLDRDGGTWIMPLATVLARVEAAAAIDGDIDDQDEGESADD